MKKKFFSIISMMLVFLLSLSVMACSMGGTTGGGGTTPGGDDDDDDDNGGPVYTNTIVYGYASGASEQYVNAIKAVIDTWNTTMYDADSDTYNFKVTSTPVASDSAVSLMGSKNNADLMEIGDKNSQAVIVSGKAEPITGVATGSISSTMLDRYRSGLDAQGRRTPYAADAKLYAVPVVTSPATIFYNENVFTNAGIKIISMPEAEAIAAGYGAYGYHVHTSIPRGETSDTIQSTTYNEIDLQGNVIENVTGYRVFNNQVAMSVEELFALSAVLTNGYNSGVSTRFGFNSEYWFPLGWTVGGDCLAYNEITDTLEFSLADDSSNYLVTKAYTVPGGDTYAAGDLVSYSDKIRLVSEISKGTASVTAAINDGTLYALPSTMEMFSYFIASSVPKGTEIAYKSATEASAASKYFDEQMYGYGVAFNPNGASSYVSSFTSGESAMLLRGYQSASAEMTSGSIATAYNVCPAPQYKEYNANGTIKVVNNTQVKGYKSTWDDTNATYLNKGSTKKAEAILFLNWLLEDAQQIALAKGKYVVTVKTQGANALVDSAAYRTEWAKNYRAGFNAAAVLDSAKYSSAPDWTYTSDNGQWVNTWSVPLNNQVRTGDASIYFLFYAQDTAGKTIIQKTNEAVAGEEVENIEIAHHKTFQ